MATMPTHWKQYGSVSALIRGECCGFRPNKHAGATYCCDENGPCLLVGAEPGARCDWFERALLPIAPPKVAKAYARSVGGEYAQLVAERLGLTADDDEEKRLCACGAALKPRERMCESCRVSARRASYRESQQKRRSGVNS